MANTKISFNPNAILSLWIESHLLFVVMSLDYLAAKIC